MSEKKVYRVKIAGVEFPIVSTEEEAYVRALADRLSGRIESIMRAGKGCTQFEAAILCCLDLMDEQVKNVSFVKDIQAQVGAQAEQICDMRATIAALQNGAPAFQNDGDDAEQLCLSDEE